MYPLVCVLEVNPRLVSLEYEEVCSHDPFSRSTRKVKELLFHGKLHFHAARMEGVVSEILNRVWIYWRIHEPKEEVTLLQGK
jgi:hypothetical protein